MTLASNILPDLHLVGAGAGTNVAPRYRYTKSGERIDNITDWALNKFVAHYGKKAGVTKDAIFAYCYAVLHDPVYRVKYAVNLKREFPRIPFYDDFAQWAGWGQQLTMFLLRARRPQRFGKWIDRMLAPDPPPQSDAAWRMSGDLDQIEFTAPVEHGYEADEGN